MRKAIFLIHVILLSTLAVKAQSKDETSIRTILEQQTEEWNKGNLEAFMSGYWQNDSLMFIGNNGISYGWQKALDNYKKGYPDTAAMGKLNFNLLLVKHLSEDYFFVIGKWHLTRTIGDVGGAFTLIFRKIKDRWLIVADHSS
jgi:ketosteroid isomerase-like protein